MSQLRRVRRRRGGGRSWRCARHVGRRICRIGRRDRDGRTLAKKVVLDSKVDVTFVEK